MLNRQDYEILTQSRQERQEKH